MIKCCNIATSFNQSKIQQMLSINLPFQPTVNVLAIFKGFILCIQKSQGLAESKHTF